MSDTVTYDYDVVPQPQGTYELQAIKVWDGGAQGVAGGTQGVALGEYDRPSDARTESEMLRGVRDFQGLEAEMRIVEEIAVQNGAIQADRADPRLFTEGPPDPFTTTRGAEIDANLGYTFRAGPEPGGESGVTLDLVHVERDDSGGYRFSRLEVMRGEDADAPKLESAAGAFNRMLADEGIVPTASAARTWSREQGGTPSAQWEPVQPELLDRREPTVPNRELDTRPLPASPDLEL